LARLAQSEKVLDRLRSDAAPTEAIRVEHVLASARAFLALACLLATWLDPSALARNAPLAYGFLVIYAVHAFLVLSLLRIRQAPSPGFCLAVHAVDVLWPALISLVTTGPNSQFFIFYVFVLLEAAYRWGLVETLATAGATIVLFLSQGILAAYGPRFFQPFLEGGFEWSRFAIRAMYLLTMGYLLGYLGEEEKELRAETSAVARSIAKVQSGLGLRNALRAVLDEVLRLFGAPRALLALQETSGGRAFLWEARRMGEDQDVALSSSEVDASSRRAYFFDPPGEAWQALRGDPSLPGQLYNLLVLDGAGIRRRNVSWNLREAFLKAQNFHSVLSVSANSGGEWSGQVFVFDPRRAPFGESRLRFLQSLCQQVAPAIYNVYLVGRLRSRAGAVERARVARELHDGVIQSLIGLEMHVDVLRREAEGSAGHVAEGLAHLQQVLRSEVLNLRELMQQMKPLDLGPRQLLDFLAYTVDKFGRDAGIATQFVSSLQEVSMRPRVCNEVARLVQEALVNVRKHSGARNVLVRFDAQDGNWRLVIDDDGRGFGFSGRLALDELDAARKGPVVIKERVRALGGELVLDSAVGRGSRLVITIPQRAHG
jgi:signal transduction histidine kinase